MTLTLRYTSLVLKILLLSLVLNSGVAYSACSMDMPETTEQQQMPCHSDNAEEKDKNCCSACLVMLLPTELKNSNSHAANSISVNPPFLSITTNIPPPFRPPITHLT